MDKEILWQTFLVTQNKSETARRMDVSLRTVHNVLAEHEEQGADLKEETLDVQKRIASKLAAKTEQLIDSITPQDIESGRIPIHDKDGNIVAYKHYGPSLSQKALAVGIMVDKVKIHNEHLEALQQDSKDKNILLPADLDGLSAALKDKIESLSFLKVNLRKEAPALETKAQEILQNLEVAKMDEPEVFDVDNFRDTSS